MSASAEDDALRCSLWDTFRARGPGYLPRTRHIAETGEPRFINRLIAEDSPYLLQHAHNPVDWRPWGAEAFTAAATDNKPVFLSIGYATCHWCHVMEVESFEDLEIAALLNREFIAVKVDREILPDVDRFYMTALLLLARQGGWPMSSFLYPNREPFFAGTYYPPSRFLQLLQEVQQLWRERHLELREQARDITRQVERSLRRTRAVETRDVLDRADPVTNALDALSQSHDALHGGFGQVPKFPAEPNLGLLLEAALLYPERDCMGPVIHQLDCMVQGGIYDHVGGGFHRYATDRHWLVPHFEKMLYNQAGLARIYTRAWELTGDPLYRLTACETLDYVLREMRDGERGFYSATDADSEGCEGKYFVWTPTQLQAVLDPKEYGLAMKLFGVSKLGNFEGASILHLPLSYAEYARAQGMPLDELLAASRTIRKKLWETRQQREPPLLDNKVIVSWNAMMIGALSFAGRLMEQDCYLVAAVQAARHLLTHHRREDGRLWRIGINGNMTVSGRQEDYASLAEALIQLYDDTGDEQWLNAARELCAQMVEQFFDPEQGIFQMCDRTEPEQMLPVPPTDTEDNTTPSGNASALQVLVKLSRRTDESCYRELAEKLLDGLGGTLSHWPHACCHLLTGMLELRHREQRALQYAGAGRLRVQGNLGDDGRVRIDGILRADGWQAPELCVVEQRLLSCAGSSRVQALQVELRVELCTDRFCLPPEQLCLTLPLGRRSVSALPLEADIRLSSSAQA